MGWALTLQYAKIAGATVAAVDLVDDKLKLARELGADYAIDARAGDPAAAIQQLGGADAAIVLAAAPAAFEQAFRSLRPGGRLVLVGLPADNEMRLPIFETVLNGIQVLGSIVGTGWIWPRCSSCTPAAAPCHLPAAPVGVGQ